MNSRSNDDEPSASIAIDEFLFRSTLLAVHVVEGSKLSEREIERR